MSTNLIEIGPLTATACASNCNGCNKRKNCVQFTGPHGYVTICEDCAEKIGDAASQHFYEKDENGYFYKKN